MKRVLKFIVVLIGVVLFLSLSLYAADQTNDIKTEVSTYGVRITLRNLYDVKDFYIARGEYNTYRELKNNGYIVGVTSAKIGNKTDYSYTVKEPGIYTILVRYNNQTERIFHRKLVVEEPTFITNGLQITVGNIPDVKVIRTAYGEWNTPGDIKRAKGSRNFSNKSVIQNSEEYLLQYRDNGVVSVAVEYNNGYVKIFHHEIKKKTPIVLQKANKVEFSGLDGLKVLRYAMGEYATSVQIKNASGSVALKATSIKDGKITLELEDGVYSFCVQYDDESYNYYTFNIESVPGRIICWGDSLTHGILTAFDNLAEYPYPRRLSQLTGMEVKNYGIGAEAAEAIAIRQGGLLLAVKPFTIPAGTTPVAIELISDLNGTPAPVAVYGLAGINPVTIGGIEGDILRYGNTIYFTRRESGDSVTLKGITRVNTFAMKDKRDNDIMVIWSGHNNDYVNGQGDKLISVIDKMIKYHGSDRYIIVGMTAERRAPAYKDINAALAEKYGDKFIDAQSYLADPVRLTELGITPSARDIDYLSRGWTPPSLLAADDLHLNQAGYDIIAQLVYEKITELGYPTYPVDKSNKQYTLTLDMGNETSVAYRINTGDHYYDVIPEYPIPKREGYQFLGWTNDKGLTLRPCDYSYEIYTLRADTTFRAKWQEEIYYSINFDPMGGVMDEGCYTSYPIRNGDYYYQAIPKYPTATKDGYTFRCWWIAEYNYALTADSFFCDYYAIYKDCTFTAVWEKN